MDVPTLNKSSKIQIMDLENISSGDGFNIQEAQGTSANQ